MTARDSQPQWGATIGHRVALCSAHAQSGDRMRAQLEALARRTLSDDEYARIAQVLRASAPVECDEREGCSGCPVCAPERRAATVVAASGVTSVWLETQEMDR